MYCNVHHKALGNVLYVIDLRAVVEDGGDITVECQIRV